MIRFATNHLDAIIPSAMQPMEHNGRDTKKDNGKDRFLLVASDIHDAESAFEKLAQKANDPSCIAFLYAGDLNVENYFINHALKYRSFTFIPVLGNCDNPWAWIDAGVPQPPQFRTLSYTNRTGDLRIYISHGHLYPYPSSVGLGNEDFEVCITGHTHVNSLKADILETSHPSKKQLVLLNPGSPSCPRGGSHQSYAMITIPNEGSAVVQIRDFVRDDLLSEMAVPLHKVKERNN